MVVIRIPLLTSIQPRVRGREAGNLVLPHGDQVNQHFDLPAGEPVHFFNGQDGHWARALSYTNPVTYSDFSHEIRETAQTQHQNAGIKDFQVIHGLALPKETPETFWVTFQPMESTTSIPIIVLHALAYGAGVRILGGALDCRHFQPYNAKFQEKKVKIKVHGPDGVKNHTFQLFQADSTPQARMQARLDLKVMKLLHEKRVNTIAALVKEARKQKETVDEKAILDSLKRINHFVNAIEESHPGHTLALTQIHLID